MQVVTPRIKRDGRDGKMNGKLQRGYVLDRFLVSVREVSRNALDSPKRETSQTLTLTLSLEGEGI
jgi:hypothetical protein